MTTKEKQGFGLYFLLAFGLAWLCQVGGCMALLQKRHAAAHLTQPCHAEGEQEVQAEALFFFCCHTNLTAVP